MKFVVSALCFVAVAFGFAHAVPTAEQMEKINKAMEVCKPKTGATDEDIGVLMKHNIPETKTGQCFVACMNKEFGVVGADNKFDIEAIKKLAAPLKEKDAAKYEKGMKVVEACITEANAESDECVIAKKMMECSKKEAAAVGMELSDFLE